MYFKSKMENGDGVLYPTELSEVAVYKAELPLSSRDDGQTLPDSLHHHQPREW